MISLDLTKSSEVRIAGDRSNSNLDSRKKSLVLCRYTTEWTFKSKNSEGKKRAEMQFYECPMHS